MTALREANQAGSLQPTTLVSYDADFEPLFDTRDPNLLEKHQITPQELSNTTWRDEMNLRGEALTQQLARDLKHAGFHGLIVRSFAPGTTDADLNLVLWTWGTSLPNRLSLIDDERRLSR
jgi:RES domain-containing protein